MAKPRQPVEVKRRIPRQERAEWTVEAIMEGAAQILEDGGLAAFTTNAVAERAGVSIGTLYQYFADKNALLVAIARREVAATLTAVGRVLQNKGDMTMEERARGMVRVILNAFRGRQRARKAMMQAIFAQGIGAELQPTGVRLHKTLLQAVPLLLNATAQTADLLQCAVQLDHPAASGATVEAIDVLGDHPGEEARLFERRQRAVGRVGLRGSKACPAEGRARPVAAPHVVAPQELGVLDRVPRATAAVASIVGDSRLGAAAGAGQRDDAPPGQQGEQRRDEAVADVFVDVVDVLANGRDGDGRPRRARGGG